MAVDGDVVWAERFRWANMETETPVTPATRFRIGGITKTLTAAAVRLLLERGKLDLDVPVQRYVPAFPEKSRPITLRHLMTHTSGVRPHRGEGGIFRGHCADDADTRQTSLWRAGEADPDDARFYYPRLMFDPRGQRVRVAERVDPLGATRGPLRARTLRSWYPQGHSRPRP